MEKKQIQVGGQAVIEGVMMRGPEAIATAIRRANGDIELKKETFISKTKDHPFYKLPLVRGFVSLIEMMIIGVKTLNFSAQRFELDMDESERSKSTGSTKEKIGEWLMIAVSFGLAFLLFGYLPYQIAEWINLDKQNVLFNIFAGSIRIVFFVLYIFIISKFKDIHRVFEYHGAEHKTVHAYEQNVHLTPENVRDFTTIHPRCGTSFMFFVLLISILIFSIVDTLVTAYIAYPPIWARLGYHFLLLPLISGISYEILRYSGKNLKHPIVKILTVPGMSLQKITTQPPTDAQLEIAIVALKAAMDLSLEEYANLRIINEESK